MNKNIKLNTKEIIKKSLNNFKATFFEYLIFESIYKIIAHLIIIPLIIFIFNLFIKISNRGVLSNTDFFKLIVNFKGNIGIFITALLTTLFIFIEFSVLVFLNSNNRFSKEKSVLFSFIQSIKKTKNVFGKGFFIIFLYSLLIIPFLDLGLDRGVFSNFKVPDFVVEYIFSDIKYAIPYSILFIIIFAFSISCIFLINIIIAEDKGVVESLKESLNIAKGYKLKIIWIMFIWNIVLVVLSIIFILIPVIIIVFAFLMTTELKYNDIVNLLPYILVWALQINFLLNIMYAPANICVISEIYYTIKNVEYIKDDLNLKQVKVIERKVIDFCKTYSLVIIIIFLSIGYFITLHNAQNIKNDFLNLTGIKVAAHRGDSLNYPENTLEAIKGSINMGADYCEIDVQLTKDGKVVVFHDKNLKRLTGINKNISDYTLEELNKIKIEESKIPTLEEALDVAKNKIKLNVELKPYTNKQELAEKVVKEIRSNNMIGSVIVQSLDYSILEKVKKLDHRLKRGYIVYMLYGNIDKYDVDFFSIEKSALTDKLVNKIHSSGKKVWAWTVNSEDDMKNLLNIKVDVVLTDLPEAFKNFVNEQNKETLKLLEFNNGNNSEVNKDLIKDIIYRIFD